MFYCFSSHSSLLLLSLSLFLITIEGLPFHWVLHHAFGSSLHHTTWLKPIFSLYIGKTLGAFVVAYGLHLFITSKGLEPQSSYDFQPTLCAPKVNKKRSAIAHLFDWVTHMLKACRGLGLSLPCTTPPCSQPYFSVWALLTLKKKLKDKKKRSNRFSQIKKSSEDVLVCSDLT